jgi:hypothetical protein
MIVDKQDANRHTVFISPMLHRANLLTAPRPADLGSSGFAADFCLYYLSFPILVRRRLLADF